MTFNYCNQPKLNNITTEVVFHYKDIRLTRIETESRNNRLFLEEL